MGNNRKRFVLLLFLFSIAPASLKLTTYRDPNEDNVLRRAKRGDEIVKEPTKDIPASQSQKNGLLDSIFSSPLDSLGILDTLRSLIPIGGNNLLNMRGKRALNDYTPNNIENGVHIAKRSLLDYDENTPNSNVDDETNKSVTDIQMDTVNEAITTENNEGTLNNINGNSIDNETVLVQNDDFNITVSLNFNGTVGNETIDGNDNSTATILNEDGSDANLRNGASENVTYNNETDSDVYQNMTSQNNDSDSDLVVNNSIDGLNSNSTANDTTDVILSSDNSTSNSRNTNSDILNDDISDVNQTSIQTNSRSASDTQNSNNETITEVSLSSNGINQGNDSQNNILNDSASSDNLELNVTVREDNINSSVDGSKLNITENNTHNDNNSPETNIFLNTRRSNSGPNSLTDLKDSLDNLILGNIPNIVNAARANNTEEVIVVHSLNDTANGIKMIKDSINKINAENNKSVVSPNDKQDNINLNLNNGTGTQLTYIHNLLVNFYFA